MLINNFVHFISILLNTNFKLFSHKFHYFFYLALQLCTSFTIFLIVILCTNLYSYLFTWIYRSVYCWNDRLSRYWLVKSLWCYFLHFRLLWYLWRYFIKKIICWLSFWYLTGSVKIMCCTILLSLWNRWWQIRRLKSIAHSRY